MKRRWIKRSGLALLLVLLGATITWSIWYAQCKAELDAEIARIRARGEPLEFADLAPREHDDVRERELRRALASIPQLPQEFFQTLDGWPPPPGEDPKTWDPPELGPGDYPVLRRAVAANRKAVDRVVRLAREGDCRFTHDYSSKTPIHLLLPHADGVSRVRSLMRAEVIQALGTDKPQRAFQVVDDMLHVGETLHHEPFFVSQGVRLATHDQAVDLLQMALDHAEINIKQQEQLDTTLKRIESVFRFRPAMVAERTLVFTVLDNVGSEEFAQAMFRPPGIQGWIDDWREAARAHWWGSALHRPWLFQEQALPLRVMTRAADLVDQPGSDADEQWEALWSDLDVRIKDYPINKLLFPALDSLRKLGFEHRQRFVSARLALRVERFRQEYDKLPSTLKEVLDARLTAIPAGLISGRPLKYETTNRGFRIYDRDPKSGEAIGKFEISRANPH